MYKNYTRKLGIPNRLYRKLLLVMRLTTVILISALMQVSAATFGQRITMSSKDTSLDVVLKEIRKQSGYNFFYDGKVIPKDRKVTVQVSNAPLKEALDIALKGLGLSYEITGRSISIKVKEPSFLERLVDRFVNIDIRGRVVDEHGNPLVGATIRLKGSSKTVRTNAEGYFSMKDVSEKEVLVISFLGYISREVAASNDVGNIKLEVAVGMLDEVGVVNTGYQRIKPEQSTGSVSQITTKQFESRISTDFLSGLTGKIAGLAINNDVKFQGNSLFQIRGLSTISANNSPLIVVDGYPTELTLDMINPNEISSVTVLKDAAASTIYGVRASNGVIVIERKQAVQGKPQISFRATAGLTPKENYSRYRWDPDASNTVVNYTRDRYKTSVNATTWENFTQYGGGTIYPEAYYTMAQRAAGLISQTQATESYAALGSYTNTEDYSRLFLRTAATQTYNLNFSGGTDKALYYITANYTNGNLQQKNNDNNRLLLSGRSTLSLSKRLTLELTTDYQEGRVNSALVPDINSIYPYERLQDEYGNPLPISFQSGVNPYYNNVIMAAGLQDNLYYPLVDVNEVGDKTHTINNRITANFNLFLGAGFELGFGGIYENSRRDIKHYASEHSSEARQYIANYAQQASDGSINYLIPEGGFLRQQTDGTTSYTARTQLNYNKQFGKDHSINAIMGAEVRKVTTQGNLAAYFGYDDQTLLQQPVNYLDLTNSNIIGSFGSIRALDYTSLFDQVYTDNRYISGYSNIVYAYRNTYSLTGSVRIDQSNLFGTNPEYKYKPLWSVGAAWNIHRENFMQDVSWVRQLKLRVAEGFNGNVAKNALPQAIAESYTNTWTNPASTALRNYAYANRNLRWEQTQNFNVGLDYGIFKGINGSIDYYDKKSTDLLANTGINPTLGLSPALVNSASIRNRGLEFRLNADWISRPQLNWNTGFILSRNTSKVLKVYQNTALNPSELNNAGFAEGYPVGALFAYRWGGLDATTGAPLVKDQNGSTYLMNLDNPTVATLANDPSVFYYMGSSIPKNNVGMSNRVDVGRFYFYCMINYYGGFKVFAPQPDPSVTHPLPGAGNYWKKSGDEQQTNIMSLDASYDGYSRYAYNNADNRVVNGDYLTLADITASYNFSSSGFFKRAGFKQFELKLQASNVYTVGLNKYNYSLATGSYVKPYITPTYTLALFTNF